MTAPLALQLYTLRSALATDFTGTIEAVAKIGYVGVETAGVYGDSVASAAKLFRDLGLKVCAMHSSLPLGDDKNRVLDTAATLGTDTIVLAWMPPDTYTTIDGIKSVAARLNEADEVVRAEGLHIAYHNHDFEFFPLADGSLPHRHLSQLCAPTVRFELDTYWIKTAGTDPTIIIDELGSRAPLLHLKDGPARRGVPMTAIGEGVLDFEAIVKASQGRADWHIVEMDECATDVLEAVRKSYDYLTSHHLSQGKNS